jgi:hypothetical protein
MEGGGKAGVMSLTSVDVALLLNDTTTNNPIKNNQLLGTIFLRG